LHRNVNQVTAPIANAIIGLVKRLIAFYGDAIFSNFVRDQRGAQRVGRARESIVAHPR
jgi:hypothetical protein